ncbi:MAG TPA: hypothetical protein VMV26_11610 [Alphaproteobacteria bacterium]|jgi:hypothetical protein|nr:hypothetical protein [Alphaproteobacteria bacterium]
MSAAANKRRRPAPRGVITDDPAQRVPLAARVRVLPDLDAAAVIARAEEAILALKDDYRTTLGASYAELTALYRAAAARPGENATELRSLYAHAFDMKGPGGTFGYALISRIGDLLCAFLSRTAVAGRRELALIGLHVDALATVIRDGIEGDGGEIGRVLLVSLEQAAAKLRARR